MEIIKSIWLIYYFTYKINNIYFGIKFSLNQFNLKSILSVWIVSYKVNFTLLT